MFPLKFERDTITDLLKHPLRLIKEYYIGLNYLITHRSILGTKKGPFLVALFHANLTPRLILLTRCLILY
jgi:hypothetical protein